VIATPGAMDLLTSFDANMALNRFQASSTFSRVKQRLLYVMGEMKPAGLPVALESLTRSKGGRFYLDTIAAIYTQLNDNSTPGRLISDFKSLDEVSRTNVIFVLGRLGQGAGVQAVDSLLDDYLNDYYGQIVDTLLAGRSEAAVHSLGRIAQNRSQDAAFLALQALTMINTPAARYQIESVSTSKTVNKSIRNKAAALLSMISK